MRAFRGLLLLCVIAGVVGVFGASTASADSVALKVVDAGGVVDPVDQVGRTFDFTVTASSSDDLYVSYRRAGGGSCAPTYYSDAGNEFIDSWYVPAGTSDINDTMVWRDGPGTFTFCMYLGDGDQFIASQDITFRSPKLNLGFATSPAAPTPHTPVTLSFTGTVEAPEELWVTYRASGGSACAPTFDSDSGTTLIDGQDINGGFNVTDIETFDAPASLQICAWVSGDSSGKSLNGGYTWSLTVAQKYTLNVQVYGSGSVVVGGVTAPCTGTCAYTVDQGTPVSLSAAPGGAKVFKGWGGGCSGLDRSCAFIMSGNRAVNATFGAPAAPSHKTPPKRHVKKKKKR